ncbi:MAG: hypothetical protein QW231_03820 [Candidatus Bathyarchaeia archaeon]
MSEKKDLIFEDCQNEVKRFLELKGKDWTQIGNRFYVFTHMMEEVGVDTTRGC